MPIVHIQISGGQKTPDGKIVKVDPSKALVMRGPCLQVTIGLADVVAEQLQKQGKPVPAPVSGIALIDTGASHTCIDDDLAKKMGLPVIDKALMTSASHHATQQNIYPARIEFTGTGMVINAPRAMGANLKSQGLAVLVGRDALRGSVLIYNGLSGEITWSR